MPVSHGLDKTAQLVRTTLYGTVTIEDLYRHVAEMQELHAPDQPEVVDARAVSSVSFGTRDPRKLADLAQRLFAHEHPAPRAVIVDNVLFFGMARVFAALVADWIQVGVFDDAARAEAWLEQSFASKT